MSITTHPTTASTPTAAPAAVQTLRDVADHLAAIVDQLRAAPEDAAPQMHVSLRFSALTPYRDQATRVDAVDQVAALLELHPADQPKTYGTGWEREARREHDGQLSLSITITTDIASPAEHCSVCGALCHHDAGVRA